MAFNSQPGLVTATVKSNATGMVKEGTLQNHVHVNCINFITGATVYTVTTGKTFYCQGFILGNQKASAIQGRLAVAGTETAGTSIAAGSSISVCAGQGYIFKATTAQVITAVHGGGSGDLWVELWGWEE